MPCAPAGRRGRRAVALGVLAVCALMPGALAAAADFRPALPPPLILGEPVVGATLTAQATSPVDPDWHWRWLRCDGQGTACAEIEDSRGLATYLVADADAGRRLRVELRGDHGRRARSQPTAVVTPLPVAGGPAEPVVTPEPTTSAPVETPEATPSPEATPDSFSAAGGDGTPIPESGPVAFTSPPEQVAPTVAPPGASARPLLRPFPIVRIKGRATRRGAVVTLLSVRAPDRARVRVRCAGRCPRSRLAVTAATRTVRLRPFERFLRAGVRLEIRITRPGYIGKHTLLRIRPLRAPARSDRCLPTPNGRPVPCF